MRVAWFEGSGHDFVEASKGIHRDGLSQHRLSPAIVGVNGSRALAETSCLIETRVMWGEIEVDTAASCRLLSRLRKDDGIWRLASLDCIYEKDTVKAVDPSKTIPIDSNLLATFRPSYRFICYNLHTVGRKINNDLPGDDRKDLTAKLYSEAREWLDSATPP